MEGRERTDWLYREKRFSVGRSETDSSISPAICNDLTYYGHYNFRRIFDSSLLIYSVHLSMNAVTSKQTVTLSVFGEKLRLVNLS